MSESDRLLEKPIVHMPHLGEGDWLNTPRPLTSRSLRGRIILVDFWDYACVNCVRTLPYMRAWYRRYHDKGLVTIGVHAPEFRFGRSQGEVAAAVAEFELPYPILLDNYYQTWERFANKAWPTKYLVDDLGYIRLQRQGEGHYRELERAIQLLLRQRDPGVALPELLSPLRPEDAPGAVCYRTTPELYAGYRGGGLYGGALGNPEGYVTHSPMHYTMPPPADREEGRFFLEGFWRADPEALVFAGREEGRVLLRYRAAGANVVLSPSSDPVEVMLGLRPTDAEPLVEVLQDGRPLSPDHAGADVHFDADGRSLIRVNRPRMYRLVREPDFGLHRLELIFHASGLALYSFTFSSCIAPPADEAPGVTYRVS